MPFASALAPRRIADTYHARRGISAMGIAGIAAAHAGLLIFLISLDIVPLPAPLSALMVQMIAPAAPVPQTTPRPQPAEHKPVARAQPVARQAQRLATQAEAPSTAEISVAKETPTATVAAPAAPAPLSPVSPARFDADYLLNPAPVYPALARRMGEEGKVVLRVFVEPEGRPSQIEIKTGSGSPLLDKAAQDTVWRWKFVAARRGAEAIGSWVLVPIVFNLRN